VKHKLSPGGQFIVDAGATPEIDIRLIKKCPLKTARGAFKKRGAGCIGGAITTKNLYATADRRALLSYAYKGNR
jgi:hypothetical protein